METRLDELIEGDPPFGEWYFSKENHFIMFPDEAYKKYTYHLSAIAENRLKEAFRLKMTIRKNGWSEEYLINELNRIKKDVIDKFPHRLFISDDQYMSMFRGVTDYRVAYATINRYRELIG